jgi:hypothetical protein
MYNLPPISIGRRAFFDLSRSIFRVKKPSPFGEG